RHHPHRDVLLLRARSARPDHLAHLTAGFSVPCLIGEQPFPARLRHPSEPGGRPAPPTAVGDAAASPAASRGSPAATGPAPPEPNGTAIKHPSTTDQQGKRAEKLGTGTCRE